jgi:glyoxylase-like metal-dependent hydrolase (beta-lactamase superfamily II)
LRALALHEDVLLVRSALLQVNCVIVRGGVSDEGTAAAPPEEVLRVVEHGTERSEPAGETFVIDSPVLADELDALPALIEQARFPAPSGLLATHGDWDHLLGRLAFPEAALGVAESTAERLGAAPGEAQRELRTFDEELLIERPRPLALGSVQALPVPGRLEVGDRELELHPTGGHTPDGMAVVIGWAGVLVCGDHLSSLEIPTLHDGGEAEPYLATLERLRTLLGAVDRVVPGHGPVLDSARALVVLEEDAAYLHALLEQRGDAELPPGRRGKAQRELHARNVAALRP